MAIFEYSSSSYKSQEKKYYLKSSNKYSIDTFPFGTELSAVAGVLKGKGAVEYSGSISPENVRAYQTLLNFVDEKSTSSGSSILASKQFSTWKDEIIPVAGKKCACHCVWCPDCFRHFWHDKINNKFSPFDWRFTRQIVLTAAPSKFSSPVEAYNLIREKRLIAEFMRRLRRGVKEKIGKKWVQKYAPVNVLRWAWFLEWHKNGFPHYHVFVQVEKEGKAGMIGADFIRDSWSVGNWEMENYFKSENHFKNVTGYYANKGYFEKNKKYQGLLPDVIKDEIKSRIKRLGFINNSEKKERREKVKVITAFDEEKDSKNFMEVVDFFKEKKSEIKGRGCPEMQMGEAINGLINDFVSNPDRKSINYRAKIDSCGEKTYIEFDMKNIRIFGESSIPYRDWKGFADGKYINGRGWVNKMNMFHISKVLQSITKVISINEYMDIGEYCRKRSNIIERERLDQENIDRMMGRN